MRARWDALQAWFAARPLMLDLALIAAVTVVAATLRLAKLGAIPYGVHPDEAQIGTDAVRILDDGWIGVYSHAALGVPTLNAYLTTPGVWLLGHTAFSLRLPLALVGLAAVPLLYLLVRTACGRVEAAFASLLLAVSYWHIFYSRVAHSSISYPTVFLAALVCIMLGLKRDDWRWWAAGGALLGVGVYAYNVYAIAFVAVGAFFAVLAFMRRREGQPLRPLLRRVALCYGAALLIALPFIVYIADPDAYYWTHIEDYSRVSITRSDEFRDASLPGKGRIMAEQVRDFAATYTWDGREDIIDANGVRPVFDPLTLVLIAAGAVLAWRRRREPMVVLAVCCALIVPLPALMQTESMMRQPLGAAPFVMFIAALPLAALWRAAAERAGARRALAAGAAGCALVLVTTITVHDYFWTWRGDPLTRYVYHSQVTSASTYMKTLPDGAYVYFFSGRHPLRLETRQFLAPDVHGEDRSYEFSPWEASITDVDRTRPAYFVLLPEYFWLLPQIERRYPGGVERKVTRDGKQEFFAYELPAGEPPEERIRAP